MEAGLATRKLRIRGMTCVNCQNKIAKKLKNTAGVRKAEVSYSEAAAVVTYDTDIVSLKDIAASIQRLGYEVLGEKEPASNALRTAGLLLAMAALYLLLRQLGVTGLFNAFPTATAGTGYGMLFVIGLLTSVHCVGMCGGINLSQSMPRPEWDTQNRWAALTPGFLYNLGRVLSYTAVGGAVGALGSVVSFSGAFKGIVQLVAGVFMVIMGVNMLGIFPWLRKLNLRMPRILGHRIDAEKGRSKAPLYVGLLNGLMPCGPLQAMQLYALSTGSPVKGALSMLLFSLGTVPLMFGLGALSSLLSAAFTKRAMTVGAVLVAVLGVSMFSQGWALSGLSLPRLFPASGPSGAPRQSAGIAPDASGIAPKPSDGNAAQDGVQIINSTLAPGRYPAITVKAGIPVKWIIDAPKGSINGCNNQIFIPEYGIDYGFTYGENIIEFTPTKTGTFRYSCWMGMIRSTITVE